MGSWNNLLCSSCLAADSFRNRTVFEVSGSDFVKSFKSRYQIFKQGSRRLGESRILPFATPTSPSPPKALEKALNRLKKRDDIVVTKPDKGSGIIVMDKSEYLRLLSAASVDDTTKFSRVDDKCPNLRGRPPLISAGETF